MNRRVGEVTVSPLRRVAVSNMGVDYIVAEVSSFQLETIEQFRPKASAILNITPDHLDRYHALKEYADTKARIFEKQNREDLLVINADDPTTMEVANEKLEIKSERPRILYFSRKKEVEGVYSINGRVYYNTPHSSLGPHDSLLINVEEIRIKGVHNLENAMAASAIAIFLNCPLEAVRDALRTFSGLEHRLEFVRELDGMRYINDSKGTNVGAVIKSLESFSDPLILILGGRDKGGDFSLLRNLVREKVKTLVLIGEAKEKIRKALGDLTETVMADDLREAVYLSRSRAVKGDVVLLSPACASFDMFLDFEDRGRQFKKIVEEFGLK
ncbi:MAG: UDP-N-acetylmuramoyl-L-alanine--D-glutamate ligase [Nitrospira sp.]|nr:UDP-N-acetylmuramoyl-L-alanine--D-glutamate ligase [Nitrospira sp.]